MSIVDQADRLLMDHKQPHTFKFGRPDQGCQCEDCKREQLRDAAPDLVKALQAVLLFHGASSWTPDVRSDWKELTGEDEATTRTLCNTARIALQKAGL